MSAVSTCSFYQEEGEKDDDDDMMTHHIVIIVLFIDEDGTDNIDDGCRNGLDISP